MQRRAGFFLGFILVAAGCASGDVASLNEGSTECTSDSECEGEGVCQDGRCVLVENDVGGDADPGDAPGEDAGVLDAPDDVDSGPDVQIGDPCDDDSDCPSGWCIEVAGGDGTRVCTDFCNDDIDCPEDWVCAAVANSGADRTFLCFPQTDFLCSVCEDDSECGALSDRCLEYPDGRFCGRSCDLRECPGGYDCLQSEREGEDPSWQCHLSAGYCSGCFDEDGDGHGDGESCLGIDCDEENPNIHEGAVEICDGVDDNCDSVPDDGFEFASDASHCGGCDIVCDFDGAQALCVDAECAQGPCLENRYDLDQRPDNGCEYFCEVSEDEVELCNGEDEDCDGELDETFDLLTDLLNCGQCDRECQFPNAVPVCMDGDCAIAGCDDLWYDIDLERDNGCEYACVVNNGGVEACDTIDNDCDGGVDEDFDLGNDPVHCGACNVVCAFDFAVPDCVEGVCGIGSCIEDHANCNGALEDGCEVALLTNVDHCGRCDEACAPFEAQGVCRDGGCEVLACSDGFADCDELDENGCESELAVDIDNCGRCDVVCDFPNADTSCSDGACVMGQCDPGWVDLDGDSDNGCEYECLFIQEDDLPDLDGIDADCDGIDGDAERVVFVRQNGSDLADGIDVDRAVATLGRALDIAAGLGDRDQILMATGSYSTGTTLQLHSGVAIYGGYSNDFRTRSDSRSVLTSTASPALNGRGLDAPVVVERLDVTVTDRNGASAAAIAVALEDSGANVTLRSLVITAGRGGNGGDGRAGAGGPDGTRGANGSGSSGGGGGSLGGGAGATGRRRASGPAGAAGASNGSPCGGSAGAGSGGGGLGCADGDPRDGGNGGSGCGGAAGSNGTGGTSLGTLSGVSWSPSHGTNGSSGANGGGGGGGGAGGGENCRVFGQCVFCGTGRGGGGGGGGGGAGGAGSRGSGGGASFGVVLSSSTVTVEGVSIISVGGGDGGGGGDRGSGGAGGGGGSGASNNDDTEGDGGDGGTGGAGGSGGCGGGGGGGPSVGIIGSGGAVVVRVGDDNVFTAGGGGAGGGSCGAEGAAGIREATRNVTLR